MIAGSYFPWKTVYLPLFFPFIIVEFLYHTLLPIHREKNLKE